MKRKIAIAAGILVTAVSTISGSYAYYQDRSDKTVYRYVRHL